MSCWESGASGRIRRIGEGEALHDVYFLPYGTDAERHELLRADCKRLGDLIAGLQWEVDEAWFAAEHPIDAAIGEAVVGSTPSMSSDEIADKLAAKPK